MTLTAVSPFSASVSFMNSGVNTPANSPHTVEITQCEFAQDIADIEFWGGDVDSDSFPSGTPMFMSWGRPSGLRYFYGYVNHVERVNNSLAHTTKTQRNAIRIVCVGASYFMKQTDTKSWTNYTSSQVVTEIGTLFHLDTSNITATSTVWANLQMAGKSYFQFCVMLAKREGYTFYVSGVQIVFKPRRTNPQNLASLAAVYDYRRDPGSMPIFTPMIGATSPGGGVLANRQLAGINPRTGQVVTTTTVGSPAPSVLGNAVPTPVFNQTQHLTVDSQQEANTKSAGAGMLNQLYLSASATAIGSAFVSQGSLVFVANVNGSENGLWFVTKAVHQLDVATYQMKLSLGRDSMGATAGVSVVPRTQNFPVASLRAGLWVAA